MNTILISVTVKKTVEGKFKYNVILWASEHGEQIRLITTYGVELDGFSSLWKLAKDNVSAYFNDEQFKDGAYTTFLDHLMTLK